MTTGRRRGVLANGLVAIQVALSVLLLSAAALLVRSVWNLNEVRAGFDPTNLLIFASIRCATGIHPCRRERSTPWRSNSSRRCRASDRQRCSISRSSAPRAGLAALPDADLELGTPAARGFFLTHEAHMLTVGDDFFSTLSIPSAAAGPCLRPTSRKRNPSRSWLQLGAPALWQRGRGRTVVQDRPQSQGNDLRGGRRLRGHEIHVAAPAVAADRLLHLSPTRRQHANICREDNRRPARRGLGRARDVPTARSQPAALLPCERRKHRSHRRCGGSG